MSVKSLAERTKELQREMILEAAAGLFSSDGPNAVTMRTIAKRSKTSTTVLYSLFGNKEGVIKALFLKGYIMFQQKLQQLELGRDPVAFLLRMCELLWDYSINHPQFYRIIHGNIFPGFHPHHMKEELPKPHPMDIAAEAITRAKQEGLFQGMPVNSVIVSMYSASIGLININLNGLFPEMELNKEKFLNLVERLLRSSAIYTQPTT